MPNIMPISNLRNYTDVLNACEGGEPVFLTKNGRGKFVVLEISEYEKQQAIIKLLSKLAEAENAVKVDSDWQTSADVRKALGV